MIINNLQENMLQVANQNSVAVQSSGNDEYKRELDRFVYSRSTELISNVPKGIVIDELLKGMLLLGIKGEKLPNETELFIMYETMLEEYKNLKIGELSLAFKLATTGKLDYEVETYQNFSVLYLHRLLRSFARYGMAKLSEYKPKQEESKWQPREVLDDEKIETAFDSYAKFKQWDCIVFGLDVFKILYKRGELTFEPQNVLNLTKEKMKQKLYSLEGHKRTEYATMFDDDDFMENQCRRLVVAQYFDKIINKG